MNYKLSRCGWLPDLPDHRDYLYVAPVAFVRAPPVKADLRLTTANAIAAAIISPVISGQFVLLRDYMETTLIKL